MPDPTILVLRATGAQGVAVLKNLQKKNVKARAYVNDPNAPRAQALLKYDAELLEGTLGDEKALRIAIEGCTGIFLNQMPSFVDDSETRDAALILDLAQKAGVKHVVHSTSLGVPQKEAVKKSGSIVKAAIVGKADVEDLVRASGLEYWTIIRGGYFDTNFIDFSSRFMFPELGSERKFICSYKPDTLLPLIDPYDIGAFAAEAFVNPTKFHRKELALAAEKRTVEQVVNDLREASGYDIKAIYRTDEETDELAKTNPIIAGAKWMTDLHKEADIEGIKQWGIHLHTFPEFLANEKDKLLATFDPASQTGTVASFGS